MRRSRIAVVGVGLMGRRHVELIRAHPDGVILATPNHLHVEQALACLEAGVPALLEKPMAPALAEAARLCAAVEGAPGARILVGHSPPSLPVANAAEA